MFIFLLSIHLSKVPTYCFSQLNSSPSCANMCKSPSFFLFLSSVGYWINSYSRRKVLHHYVPTCVNHLFFLFLSDVRYWINSDSRRKVLFLIIIVFSIKNDFIFRNQTLKLDPVKYEWRSSYNFTIEFDCVSEGQSYPFDRSLSEPPSPTICTTYIWLK